MEAARPGRRTRRQSRGSLDTTSHMRLVRVGFLVAAPAVIALLFAVSTPGTLPQAPLEPLFDGQAATELATALTTEYPSRVPGSAEAEGAALWYHETIGALGLATEDDEWEADLADLGDVTLRNVVTVVPGRSEETVVVIAHRDNAGVDQPGEDNAGGTAALIELARGFAPQENAPDPQPQRTLVLVSTDAGVYGGAGAERFASTSPYAERAVAAVVLEGLGGAGRPELHVAGDVPVSSARALVGTATTRISEQAGIEPTLPSLATQLADLALPFSASEQGRLLARDVAAITVSTSRHHVESSSPRMDGSAALSPARVETLGRAVEELLDSLDWSVGAPFGTTDNVYFQGRVVSGWAVRLTLVLLVVPFALGLVDLLARARRRRVPIRPALRGLRTRFLLLLLAGLLVALGALTGLFPTGDALPLPSFTSTVAEPSVAGLGVLALVLGIAWMAGRRRLVPSGSVSVEDRLAGLVTALGLLGVLAVVLAVTKPYALVFTLPSLYAWLWIKPERAAWQRVFLYVIGLGGPVAGLALLGRELGLDVIETPLYVLGLVTVGYVSLASLLLAFVWLTAAAQIGAIAFGRYGPYAGGAEPPPPGVVRRAVSRPGRRSRQSSGR